MSAPDNPLAFPSVEEHPSYEMPILHFGMSLRDYIASGTLAGLLASEGDEAWAAERAYKLADAMLAERAKGQS